jgi:hypothetical protein
VTASSNPVETMQMINSGQISIRTLLDTLEILDAKSALEDHERKIAEEKARQRASQK